KTQEAIEDLLTHSRFHSFRLSLSLSLKTNDATLARVHGASISRYKPSLKTNLQHNLRHRIRPFN
ncbi:hypothetical protein TorRG33x02_349750, partial [Trema orientale]